MELTNNSGGEVENENIQTDDQEIQIDEEIFDTKDNLETEVIEQNDLTSELVENTYNEYFEQVIQRNDEIKTVTENILNTGIVSLVIMSILVGAMCANIFSRYFHS